MSPSSSADEVVDELLPDELDWVDLVQRYPKTSLMVAAVGGYILGSSRGQDIVQALSLYAVAQVTEGVNHYLGQKVL